MKQIFIVAAGILFLVPQLFAADSSVIQVHIKMYERDTFYLNIGRAYSTVYYSRDSSVKNSETVCFNEEADITAPSLKGCNLYNVEITSKTGEKLFSIPVAMEGGDSVSLYITNEKIPAWGNRIIVSGSNADAHNLILQNPFTLSQYVYMHSDSSFRKFYIASTFYIDSLLQPLYQMLAANKVSLPCYELYLADEKSKLYYEVLEELAHIYHKAAASYERAAMLLNYKDLAFFKGDAHNPLLLKTFDGAGLYNEYLNYILDIDPLYDTTLSNSYYACFNLYDSSYRCFAWGQRLYSSYKMFDVTKEKNRDHVKESLNKDNAFKRYKSLYPGSGFIPLIEAYVYGNVLTCRDDTLHETKSKHGAAK